MLVPIGFDGVSVTYGLEASGELGLGVGPNARLVHDQLGTFIALVLPDQGEQASVYGYDPKLDTWVAAQVPEQAAMALEPLVGVGARYLFAAGVLGASLLASSVLPLSTAYAVCEAFGWERGLDQRPREARIFYGLYAGIIVLSVLVVLIPGIPLFPLMWLSQSMNAILLPVLLILVLKLVNDRRIMGTWTNSRLQNGFVWALTLVIGLITLVLLASPLLGVQAPV